MTSALAYVSALLLVSPALAESPLRVQARVEKATYYAGQAIDVRVAVVAEGERPTIVPPKIQDAAVVLIDTAFRPVGVSGIGDVVSERNAFITRYRVTPERPGSLTIPPFVARLGERKGASAPIRLTIHAVPQEGRPASFLRGVGPIEARAEAAPAAVRVGQPFEYRVLLIGPGAPGSSQWPILSGFERIAGLTIEPAGTEPVAEPPSRTFRYRARATGPGTLALPSVAVASFHPDMGRYVETRAPGVSVRVIDVPRFDPATLPAIANETDADSGLVAWIWIIAAILMTAAWAMVVAVRSRTSARRWARKVARGLAANSGGVAERLASGLRGYLARAGGHRGGELTPDEAAREVGQMTGDIDLAERARRLAERSDRARFGAGGAGGDGDPGLAADASSFFDDLARRRPKRSS